MSPNRAIQAVLLTTLLAACSSEDPEPVYPPYDAGSGKADAPDGDDGDRSVAGCPSCTLLVRNQGGEGLAVDSQYVYWTRDGMINGAINRAPLAGGPTTVLVPDLDMPVDIVSHPTGLYWVAMATHHTINNGSISWLSHGGSSPTILAEHQWDPLRMALDDASIFWTNSKGDAIMKVPIDRSFVAVTFAKDDQHPYGIAVDDANVYWTATGKVSIEPGSTSAPPPAGFVMRAPKSGGEPTTVASGQAYPLSIAAHGDHVYWVNVGLFGNYDTPGTGSVMKAPIDGGPPVVVVPNLNAAWDLAVDDANIYYATIGTKANRRCDGTIEKVPLGGGAPTVIASQQCWPSRVAIDATHVYFATASSTISPDPPRLRKDAGIIRAPK